MEGLGLVVSWSGLIGNHVVNVYRDTDVFLSHVDSVLSDSDSSSFWSAETETRCAVETRQEHSSDGKQLTTETEDEPRVQKLGNSHHRPSWDSMRFWHWNFKKWTLPCYQATAVPGVLPPGLLNIQCAT